MNQEPSIEYIPPPPRRAEWSRWWFEFENKIGNGKPLPKFASGGTPWNMHMIEDVMEYKFYGRQ
jgi:hypothetical protein